MLLIAVLVTVTGNRQNSTADGTTVTPGGTQTVAVRLADMRITPSLITVATGTHVVLEVTNTDTARHDLLVGVGSRTPCSRKAPTCFDPATSNTVRHKPSTSHPRRAALSNSYYPPLATSRSSITPWSMLNGARTASSWRASTAATGSHPHGQRSR